MAKVNGTYEEILRLAEDYGLENNPLFVAAAKQYDLQRKVIEEIEKAIGESDSMTTEKTYLKDTSNTYANPLIKELPKHSDSANKTMQTMLDIIVKLGHEKQAAGKLSEFNAD